MKTDGRRGMVAVLGVLLALPGFAQRWDHDSSPYRAIFAVTSPPTVEDAGYFLEVPLCGIGDPDGDEVYVYDQDGKRYRNTALGRGRRNGALVLATPDPGVRGQPTKLLAYFGSGKNAPQRRGKLLHGPVVDIRIPTDRVDTTDWDSTAKSLERTRRLGIVPLDAIEFVTNPVDTTANYLAEFRGFLYAPQAARWQVFLVNSGAGFFFANDQLLIDRKGKHNVHDARRGEGRAAVEVTPAGTPFRIVTASLGEPHMVVLARFIADNNKVTLDAKAFIQSGQTRLETIAGYGRRECPAFTYAPVTYMSLPDLELTEVVVTGYGGDKMEWALGDGARAKGAEIRHICVGVRPVPVAARVGRATAQGQIVFNEVPEQWYQRSDPQFDHYSEVMLQEDLPHLQTEVLLAYLDFLRYRERNPHCAPVAAVLVDQLSRTDGQARSEALLTLARTAARDDPERAAAAWEAFLRSVDAGKRPELLHEYLEFELYRHAEPAQVAAIIDRVARLLKDDPTLLLYRGEAAMLAGDVEGARTQFGILRRHLTASEGFRALRIQGNALLEQHRQYLVQGFYYQAEEALRRWATISPGSIGDGQYVLVRCRWLRQIGWPERVPLLIDAFLKLNDLPAFLPDLEMTKALALKDLGREDAARQLFEHIVQSYPNHPVAAEAQAYVK